MFVLLCCVCRFLLFHLCPSVLLSSRSLIHTLGDLYMCRLSIQNAFLSLAIVYLHCLSSPPITESIRMMCSCASHSHTHIAYERPIRMWTLNVWDFIYVRPVNKHMLLAIFEIAQQKWIQSVGMQNLLDCQTASVGRQPPEQPPFLPYTYQENSWMCRKARITHIAHSLS